MTRPLDGVTVVAIEQAVAAPLATRSLADLGARVIKVERVDGGDFARGYDHVVHGTGAHFVWLNRAKESIAIDLKVREGCAVVRGLAEQADVFVQNLAPGAAERLGLGAEELWSSHPPAGRGAPDDERLNPNGSGISLERPVGATGARVLTTLLYELTRRRARYGLETMCIGGGQGLAAVFERI